MFGGARQRRERVEQLLVADIDYIARADTKDGMKGKSRPSCPPQGKTVQEAGGPQTAQTAIAFYFEQQRVDHASDAEMAETDRVSHAGLDGSDIGRAKKSEAYTVLGSADGIEIAKKRALDGITTHNSVGQGQGAIARPLLLQFLKTDIIVEIVATLDQAIAGMAVGIAIDRSGKQRLTRQWQQTVIVADHRSQHDTQSNIKKDDAGHQTTTKTRGDPATGKTHQGQKNQQRQNDESGVGLDEGQEEEHPQHIDATEQIEPYCTTPTEQEIGHKADSKAEVEGETDVGDIRHNVAVGQARHGEETHPTDDGDDEQRGEVGSQDRTALALLQGWQRKHHKGHDKKR